MQRIALVINQAKDNVKDNENIKDNVLRCYQHIIQKYHTTYFDIV